MRHETLELVRSNRPDSGARVDEADVFERESESLEVEFRQGKFYSQALKGCRGCGVRVIREGRLGFAASTNPARLGEMVTAAIDAAGHSRPVQFHLPPSLTPSPVKIFENRVMLVSAERLREWGRDLIDAMAARAPEVKLDIRLRRAYRKVGIVSTSGIDLSFEQAELDVAITALLVDDGIYWISDYLNLSNGQPLPLEATTERLATIVEIAKRKERLKTGEYPVVVMPTAVYELLLPLTVAVNGKQKEKKTSPLLGREGAKVLSENFTIVDNHTRPFSLASAPFDGEGVPAKRNTLFEKGVFKGFLFDVATASACGCESTGSAVRDYSYLPQPGVSNLEVAPGVSELDEVLKDLKEGLIVYSFIGGGQSNLLAGEVTLNVSCGFKVENGAVVGRVKDVSIGGNVYEMFKDVLAVGNTQKDLGNAFLPFIAFSRLKVATKG